MNIHDKYCKIIPGVLEVAIIGRDSRWKEYIIGYSIKGYPFVCLNDGFCGFRSPPQFSIVEFASYFKEEGFYKLFPLRLLVARTA